jgi:hypothetical protein
MESLGEGASDFLIGRKRIRALFAKLGVFRIFGLTVWALDGHLPSQLCDIRIFIYGGSVNQQYVFKILCIREIPGEFTS